MQVVQFIYINFIADTQSRPSFFFTMEAAPVKAITQMSAHTIKLTVRLASHLKNNLSIFKSMYQLEHSPLAQHILNPKMYPLCKDTLNNGPFVYNGHVRNSLTQIDLM